MANLAGHLFRQARAQPDKVALHFGDESLSFADLALAVRQTASRLVASGVTQGERVGLMLPSCPDFIIYQQALFTLGAAVSPINTQYRAADLEHAVASCGLHHLLVAPDLLDRVPDRQRLHADFRSVTVARTATHAEPNGALAEPADLPESAIGMMLCTSATTGKAKGVPLTIANIQANYDKTPAWLGLSGDTIILCALPLYNTFALNQCISALMVTGATMVLLPAFDVPACLHAIETHRCNFFPAVPTMLRRLLDHAQTSSHDLSSITRIMTGGAPVPAPLLERIRNTMGAQTVVLTGYGLTEATALVTLDEVQLGPDGRVLRPKSIGRVLPGMELRVADEGTTGGVGEFLIRGPNVMQGYFGLPEETSAVLSDGWLHTGDLGTIDADGYATIVDRKKDIVIRGGQNIYPADIEDVLYALPGVSEAAVIAMPDDDFGEVPIGFVALREGTDLSAESMIAHCRAHLARFKVPAAIHVLPELPKGPTGKILRRALRSAQHKQD